MSTEQVTPPSSWSAPLERFDRWLRSCGRPASTRYLRLYHLRRLGAQLARGPWEVTAEDLEAHLAAGEWSGNTRRSVRSTLRSFYTWAHSRGLSESNPATLLPSQTAPIGTPRPAPESSIVAGLNALDARVRLMVRLAAEYGLRCSEIAQVHSDDLVEDLVGWSLAVHGKGAKRRIVPLSAAMASIIADARGYLFEGRVDGHLSGAYVSKLVSRYLPPGVTAHMLRHRFASRAYAVDCDLRAVQELLGHASIATTQIYTAVPDGSLRRAVSGAAA